MSMTVQRQSPEVVTSIHARSARMSLTVCSPRHRIIHSLRYAVQKETSPLPDQSWFIFGRVSCYDICYLAGYFDSLPYVLPPTTRKGMKHGKAHV